MSPDNILFQWKIVPFRGMGWLMAHTMCLVKIQCMGSYNTITWCDQCCRDNHVDHREFHKVQVHMMAWWHHDDGVMRLAQINVAGLRSDRTLDYKTQRGFRVIIKSLTAQHPLNSYSSPLSYHVDDQLLPILYSPRWHYLGSQGFKACEASYWQRRLSCF